MDPTGPRAKCHIFHVLCRFTEKLRARPAGKGGSHRRHDCAALPPAWGSSCCWGKTRPVPKREGPSPVCYRWWKPAWVWPCCCLAPTAKDGEETVGNKLEEEIVSPLISCWHRLLLGSPGRICSVPLLLGTSVVQAASSVSSIWPWLLDQSNRQIHVKKCREKEVRP